MPAASWGLDAPGVCVVEPPEDAVPGVLDAGAVPVVVIVVVPFGFTTIEPFIASPWTVHQNVYVRGWVNVQLPLQLVPEWPAPTGTVLAQAGTSGPLFHSTPCSTVVLFMTVTVPPPFTVAVIGDQRCVSP